MAGIARGDGWIVPVNIFIETQQIVPTHCSIFENLGMFMFHVIHSSHRPSEGRYIIFVLSVTIVCMCNSYILKGDSFNLCMPAYYHIRNHILLYLIQHYVIKFVSDLRQVSGFLRVLWFPPPIKLKYC
jgi:hypothetical protein